MSQAKAAIAFTKGQIDYIKTQKLARIATASLAGEPDVAAVGFEFDGEYFYIGEHPGMNSRKYRNVQQNPKASLVIDDVITNGSRKFRMLKIRGHAEFVDHTGYMGTGKYIRIKPVHLSSFGLD